MIFCRNILFLFLFIFISPRCFSQTPDTTNYKQAYNDSRYKELISAGDLQFRSGNYTDAKVFYLDAMILMPDDQYAFDRVTTCNLRLRQQIGNHGKDAEYDNLIYSADYCFQTRYYIDAKKKYKAALAVKPTEQYPKNMIAACDYKIAEFSPNAKDSLLPQFLKQADSLFAAKDYSNAMQWYKVAVNFSQGEANVQKKIDRLKIILDSIDYAEKNPAIEYWPNGNKKAERTGNKHGTFYYREYNINGVLTHEGQITNGQQSGMWLSYFPATGLLSEKAFYKSGAIDSTYESWYSNGKPYVTGKYKKGMREGLWQEYSDSGYVMNSTNYKNDLRDGVYTEYFPSGKKSLVAHYVKDQSNGIWTEYYEAGNIKNQKVYVGDMLNGVEIGYWPNGKKNFQFVYKNGELVEERHWDEKGKEIISAVVH